jgi:hypothetical protein
MLDRRGMKPEVWDTPYAAGLRRTPGAWIDVNDPVLHPQDGQAVDKTRWKQPDLLQPVLRGSIEEGAEKSDDARALNVS